MSAKGTTLKTKLKMGCCQVRRGRYNETGNVDQHQHSEERRSMLSSLFDGLVRRIKTIPKCYW